MPFTGFTSEAGEFLWELAFHNEKPWFEAHKEQFLRAVKEPFDALAKETLALMRQKHPDEPYCLHISRIYRDARRLFGRGPYKDHLWFTLWTGEDRHNSPVFWFELSPASFSYGVGFYTATAEQMAAGVAKALGADIGAVQAAQKGCGRSAQPLVQPQMDQSLRRIRPWRGALHRRAAAGASGRLRKAHAGL